MIKDWEWVDCWNCLSTGYTYLPDSDDKVVCDVCNGEGGYFKELKK